MKRCFHVRFRFLIFMGLALLGGSAVVSRVQGQLLQGSITGNVADSSGAAIPDAKVVAREQQTNFTRETTTNTSGIYNLPTMQPGTYTISVTSPSFQTTTVSGVLVSPEEVTRRDVVLSLGQVNQTVEVQAEAVSLQSDRAEIRDDLTAHALENLPVPPGPQLSDAVYNGSRCLAADQFEFLYRQLKPRTNYCGQWRKHQYQYCPCRRHWHV